MAVLRKKRSIILLGGHGRASNGSRGDRWCRLSLENALANRRNFWAKGRAPPGLTVIPKRMLTRFQAVA